MFGDVEGALLLQLLCWGTASKEMLCKHRERMITGCWCCLLHL